MEKNLIQATNGFTYLDTGKGTPLLVLHGLFGAMSNFHELTADFSTNYRVIVPVLPICESAILDSNLDALTDYIARFIDFLQLDRFILLGNSLGGHLSLLYTLRHPEKITQLVLTGSSGLYENDFGGSYPRRGDRFYLKEKIASTFYDPAMASDDLVDTVYAIVNDRTKLFKILAIAKSAIRHNLAHELPQIKLPVCLIWGNNDIVTPPDVAKEFHRLLPHSELFWIEECGHAPMMEKPSAFNSILKNWLIQQKN